MSPTPAGESISIVDLDAQQVTGGVLFPPLPRAGAAAPAHAVAMAVAQSGLQFLLATNNNAGTQASQWEVIGGAAVLRQADSIAVNPANTAQSTLPGALADGRHTRGREYPHHERLRHGVSVRRAERCLHRFGQLFTAPIQGYYGPLGAAPAGAYFLANNLVLSSSITSSIQEPGTRNVAAVAPIDQTTFLRLTTPQRTTNGAATRDDPRTLLELFDLSPAAKRWWEPPRRTPTPRSSAPPAPISRPA